MISKSGLEKIVGTGTECNVDLPTSIKSFYRMLEFLGQVYGPKPAKSTSEYITNAMDEGATEIIVRLNKKGKNQEIMIEDNGSGMRLPDEERKYIERSLEEFEEFDIAKDSILRLPKKIADSGKRGDKQKQGKKGIGGTLGWQATSNRLAVFSKQDGLPAVGWSVSKSYDSENEPEFSGEFYDSEISEGFRNEQGTTVILSDLKEDIFRTNKKNGNGKPAAVAKITPGILQKLFSVEHRDALLGKDPMLNEKYGDNHKVSITIIDEKGTYQVKPEVFTGEPFIHETINTEYGKVYVEINSCLDTNGEVRLINGLQGTLENIGKEHQSDLASIAWKSGYFTGKVRSDFIDTDTGRGAIVTNEKSDALFEALRQYNDRLEEYVDTMKKSTDKAKNLSHKRQMERVFRKLKQLRPELSDILSGRYQVARRGVLVNGDVGDEDPSLPPQGGPGKGTHETEEGDQEKLDPLKPYESGTPGKRVDPTKPGKTRARPTPSLTINFEKMDPGVISRYEEEFSSVIHINESHPAYQKSFADERRHDAYLTMVIGKELLSRLPYEGNNLIDELITFQQDYMNLIANDRKQVKFNKK